MIPNRRGIRAGRRPEVGGLPALHMFDAPRPARSASDQSRQKRTTKVVVAGAPGSSFIVRAAAILARRLDLPVCPGPAVARAPVLVK